MGEDKKYADSSNLTRMLSKIKDRLSHKESNNTVYIDGYVQKASATGISHSTTGLGYYSGAIDRPRVGLSSDSKYVLTVDCMPITNGIRCSIIKIDIESGVSTTIATKDVTLASNIQYGPPRTISSHISWSDDLTKVACVSCTSYTTSNTNYYDVRYFYWDGIGTSITEISLEVINESSYATPVMDSCKFVGNDAYVLYTLRSLSTNANMVYTLRCYRMSNCVTKNAISTSGIGDAQYVGVSTNGNNYGVYDGKLYMRNVSGYKGNGSSAHTEVGPFNLCVSTSGITTVNSVPEEVVNQINKRTGVNGVSAARIFYLDGVKYVLGHKVCLLQTSSTVTVRRCFLIKCTDNDVRDVCVFEPGTNYNLVDCIIVDNILYFIYGPIGTVAPYGMDIYRVLDMSE